MRHPTFVFPFLFSAASLYGQSAKEKKLKLSLQTDLLAYTTAGAWSAWASAQLDRYKRSVALVNYPNQFRKSTMKLESKKTLAGYVSNYLEDLNPNPN